MLVMFASAVTALLIGFSDEFWTNAVETETYMPSLIMSMFVVWLVLSWAERKDNPSSVRYLFLAAYFIGLGNGIHMMGLLIVPTVFFMVIMFKPEWFNSGKLWLSASLFLLGAVFIKLFAGREMLYLTMALFAFAAPVVIHRLYQLDGEVWKRTLLGLLLCGSLYMIGYTVYPTVMVRAQKKPFINEGNPDIWRRYKLYLDRDQYGQGNMFVGMFERNAEFSYQFGYMYLRYLIQQFPIWGPSIEMTFENNRSADQPGEVNLQHRAYLSVLLMSVLLYGLYTHGREDVKSLIALLCFFLSTSIGLILYLNMENPQVRDRAYFFLGSYYSIMFWLGFGIYGLITDIIGWLESKNRPQLIKPAAMGLCIIFGTLPPAAVLSRHIDPDFNNFQVHDRTHDWISWDYGYNILASCDDNAILFTNGDNDTFPLWYLQEVMGIRKDVRIVNLSLLNTDWYILQLKHENPPVPDNYSGDGIINTLPIQYSEDYIENTLCGRDYEDLAARLWPLDGQEVTAAGITWHLPAHDPARYRFALSADETVGTLRIQDKMVANIIQWVNWQRPIYFAVTVATENKIGLEDYLAMEGMVYRLVSTRAEPGQVQLNVPVMEKNVFEKYRYRSLDDPTIYKPPNSLKLVTNYFIGFAQLCEQYLAMGEHEKAVRTAWAAIDRTPNDFGKRVLLYQLFATARLTDELEKFIDWEVSTREFYDDIANRILLYRIMDYGTMDEKLAELIDRELESQNFGGFQSRLEFGTLLLQYGIDKQAMRLFEKLVADNPENIEAFRSNMPTYMFPWPYCFRSR
ncbi:hypothetical protein ES708_16437 [subsurface metagenome]